MIRLFIITFHLAEFLCFYIKEIILSNLKIAYDIITPTHHMKPGVIGMPLSTKTDLQTFLVANLISMTPGTLSLDVSSDQKTLYIHSMYIKDVEKLKTDLKKGIESRILKIFKDS